MPIHETTNGQGPGLFPLGILTRTSGDKMRENENQIMDVDTSKECFVATWPGGYYESWNGVKPEWEQRIVEFGITPFASKDKMALEIGCGQGLWTIKYLCPLFHHVTAMDLLPPIDAPVAENLSYIEVPERDFTCHNMQDECVDFAFSYNTFPHLSGGAQQAYLRGIFRVLQPGGDAVVHFANMDRHPWGPTLRTETNGNPNVRHANGACWFYNDMKLTVQWVEAAGFTDLRDLMVNDYRDTLLAFRKPKP